MKPQWIFYAVFSFFFSGCAQHHLYTDEAYRLSGQLKKNMPEQWKMQGRMGVVAEKDSFSAFVNWTHVRQQEQIELSGPLGQGGVMLILSHDVVVVNDGKHSRKYYQSPAQVFFNHFGVELPVDACVFWLYGIPQPDVAYSELSEGFGQHGWQVVYRQLQNVQGQLLPRKMTLKKGRISVKFLIDQWNIQ